MLGPPARTPVEPLVGDRPSAVGGHADWIDDADFPACPGCGRRMMLLAHVALHQLGSDGAAYAFACADCRATAVNVRCT